MPLHSGCNTQWQCMHNLFTFVFSFTEKVLLQWDWGWIKFENLIRISKVFIQIFIKELQLEGFYKKEMISLILSLLLFAWSTRFFWPNSGRSPVVCPNLHDSSWSCRFRIRNNWWKKSIFNRRVYSVHKYSKFWFRFTKFLILILIH